MKIIKRWLNENPYLREVKHTIFLSKLFEAIDSNLKTSELKKKSCVSGLIKYPNGWPSDLDIFKFFHVQIIEKIQKKECYFIFDASAEGFSPLYENWFDILYLGCEKYNIDPRQIIFTSSNLKDEETLEKYCNERNKIPINLISFSMFENSISLEENTLAALEKAKIETSNSYSDKFFSSLSRLKRQHRIISQFLICQSEVKNHALISQDKLTGRDIYLDPLFRKYPNYNIKSVKRWSKGMLPLTIDQTDFNYNWACVGSFSHIHHQTIFQLVNETLVDNLNNTSLFYSEKTYRPISCFQPFIIFGQPGCNHHLKNLGYKLYDDWFDLSFDFEENYIDRIFKIIKVLEDTCSELKSMSREKQIEWKFKNEEVLIHNYNTTKNQEHSQKKLKQFVLLLDNQVKNH